MTRGQRLLRWLPLAVCLIIHFRGLFAWFQMDDFHWLSMLAWARSGRGVLGVLATPTVHGSWRPLSEPALFMLFTKVFGFEPLPFRLLAMGTQLVNVALLGVLARRLWRSELAGVIVPILWVSHAALVMPMVWSASYNQLLASLVFLGGTVLVDVWVEGGRRRTFALVVAVFVAGLLAQETVVMFPFVAAAWIAVRAPRERRRAMLLHVAPLMGVSLLYVSVHLLLAPAAGSGPYALHVDAGMLRAAWWYWRASMVADCFSLSFPVWLELSLVAAFTVALVAVVAASLRRGEVRPLVGLAWYGAVLAPALPLSEHLTDYLLTIPTIGLALAVGGPLAHALAQEGRARILGAAALAVWLLAMAPMSFSLARRMSARTAASGQVFPALLTVRATQPDRPIILEDVSEDVFELAIVSGALRSLGLKRIYLSPEAARRLRPRASGVNATDLLPPDHERASALTYSLAGDHLSVVLR